MSGPQHIDKVIILWLPCFHLRTCGKHDNSGIRAARNINLFLPLHDEPAQEHAARFGRLGGGGEEVDMATFTEQPLPELTLYDYHIVGAECVFIKVGICCNIMFEPVKRRYSSQSRFKSGANPKQPNVKGFLYMGITSSAAFRKYLYAAQYTSIRHIRHRHDVVSCSFPVVAKERYHKHD